MKHAEWLDIAALMTDLWPFHPLPRNAVATFFAELEDLDAVSVQAAVRAINRDGKEFPPNAGQIRAKASDLGRPAATFEHVWAEIHRAVRSFGWPRAAEALRSLAEVPFALDLVSAMGGWVAVCSAGPDEARPTDPGVWRAQAEHAFKALTAQRRDDEALAGLPGLRAEAAVRRLAAAEEPPALPEPRQLPPAEPLRIVELPPAKTLGDPQLRPAIILPPTGPAYRHGPTCVCERCMPALPAAPATEQPTRSSTARSPRSGRRRTRHGGRR